MTYFTKVPQIFYANTLCRDLSRRSKVVADNMSSPYVFYPYEIQDDIRPDLLSEFYYSNATLDYTIYISNDIVDPYYGWYITNENFEKFIIDKYGSVEDSQKYIKFWRNNWAADSTTLTPSAYNNNIVPSFRKYYTPVLGVGTSIIKYVRKQDDTVVNTNRIMQYTVLSNNSTIALQVGELVDFKATGQEVTLGTGEVEIANSTVIRIKNVLNDVAANTTNVKDIVGETSGANVSVNNSVIYFENFSNTEANFWEPIYQYDYEVELNEQKKNIYLIGDDVINEFDVRFTTVMQQNTDENGFIANT